MSLLACILKCLGNMDKLTRSDADKSLSIPEAEKHEFRLPELTELP
jgi:hypothetical protein